MTRPQKLLIMAAAVILLVAFLWLRSCSDARDKGAEAEIQTHAREADAAAAEQRASDTATIKNQSEEIRNALAPLPDAPLSPRQRARACGLWLQQHPGDHTTGC